jgi:hypothetical protein
MKLGDTEMAGKASALIAAKGRKAAALAKMTIVAGAVLGCCLACDSGATSTASGGQPPNSVPAANPVPAAASNSMPATPPAPASSQPPETPAATGQPTGATTKSQYLSSLHNVSNSGTVFYGNGEMNGHHFRNSVLQVMDGQAASVSYNLGRKWRALDMTLGLLPGSSGSGSVEFQVKADNRIIYTGDVAPGQSRHVRLKVAGVARLDLTSTLMANGATTNFVSDWGSARLLG